LSFHVNEEIEKHCVGKGNDLAQITKCQLRAGRRLKLDGFKPSSFQRGAFARH